MNDARYEQRLLTVEVEIGMVINDLRKVIFGVSLTAPLSLGLMSVPVLNKGYLGELTFFCLLAIPELAGVLIPSLRLTRFSRARRLLVSALLIDMVPQFERGYSSSLLVTDHSRVGILDVAGMIIGSWRP